jgi:hypothetical protein
MCELMQSSEIVIETSNKSSQSYLELNIRHAYPRHVTISCRHTCKCDNPKISDRCGVTTWKVCSTSSVLQCINAAFKFTQLFALSLTHTRVYTSFPFISIYPRNISKTKTNKHVSL